MVTQSDLLCDRSAYTGLGWHRVLVNPLNKHTICCDIIIGHYFITLFSCFTISTQYILFIHSTSDLLHNYCSNSTSYYPDLIVCKCHASISWFLKLAGILFVEPYDISCTHLVHGYHPGMFVFIVFFNQGFQAGSNRCYLLADFLA